MIAPRNGPDMRSHSMGGPAWRNKLSFIPGMTSRAVATALRMGRASIRRLTAVVLALSISIIVSIVCREFDDWRILQCSNSLFYFSSSPAARLTSHCHLQADATPHGLLARLEV